LAADADVRSAVLRQIAALVRPGSIVAIDGVDGAGKTTFANDLACVLDAPTIRSTVDGFHQPRAVRHARGRHSPEGFFLDSYDYSALRGLLLDPFRAGEPVRTAAFDHRLDAAVPALPTRPHPSAVLVLDGLFLHRPELRGYWDLSVFLRVDFAVTFARMAVRDGSPADPSDVANRRYLEGQRLYLSSCSPEDRASLVVDHDDPAAPRIVSPSAECWLHPSVFVGASAISGLGLFARSNLSTGTVISRLGGHLVSTVELRDLLARASSPASDMSYVDTITVGPDRHLVLPPGTPNGKGNHSCDPNLWWSGPYTLVARRDIAAGEELTNDYATSTRWTSFAMACACGTALCRGTVTGNDWTLRSLHERYGDHWTMSSTVD
jgi:uridine kinase